MNSLEFYFHVVREFSGKRVSAKSFADPQLNHQHNVFDVDFRDMAGNIKGRWGHQGPILSQPFAGPFYQLPVVGIKLYHFVSADYQQGTSIRTVVRHPSGLEIDSYPLGVTEDLNVVKEVLADKMPNLSCGNYSDIIFNELVQKIKNMELSERSNSI